MAERYRLIGGNGSPYSMKVRALMRYRRLAFDWVLRTPEVRAELAHLRPQLVPVLQYPEDGSFHLDSTFIARDLETRHPGQRSIMPDDPALNFLAFLIEDMADEWGTKMMFHYRWARPLDQDYCSRWIIHDAQPKLIGQAFEAAADKIKERQIGRMALVGCTPENAALLETGYHRVLEIFSTIVPERQFLFGSRPSLADFGWFGQLKTLADDPTPMSIMRQEAQVVADWVRWLDDASGSEGEWQGQDAPLRDGVIALLEMAGDSYLPFLAANAAAAAAGETTLELQLSGQTYRQAVFGYQVKCLNWLRQAFGDLDGAARARLEPILAETNCLSVLT